MINLPSALSLSRKTVGSLGFLLFLFLFQIRYLATFLYAPAIAASAILLLVSIDFRKTNRKWLAAAIVFAIYTALSWIMYITKGDEFARILFVPHFLNLLTLLFFANQCKSQSFKRFFLHSLVALALLESTIIILQSLHAAYGVGMAPRHIEIQNVLEQHLHLYASYGNPNNSAIVIAMVLLVLQLNGLGHVKRYLLALLYAIAGLAIFITLSRAALLFFVALLALALLKLVRNKKVVIISSVAVAFITFGTLSIGLPDQVGLVLDRSLVKLETIPGLSSGDESVEFRITSYQRLFENLPNLGLGTQTDIQYWRFYKQSDPFVAKINPHSFIVESSFLYGYIGLILAGVTTGIIILAALSKSESLHVRLLFILGFLVFQSVPSSLFGLDQFLFIAIAGSLF